MKMKFPEMAEEEDEEVMPAEEEAMEGDEPESAEEKAMEMETPGAEAAEAMSIPLPEGFQPPEGTKDGDTFEIITKAKVKDGRLMFESFDGQPTKGASEDSDESDAMAEETLRQAVKAGGLRG